MFFWDLILAEDFLGDIWSNRFMSYSFHDIWNIWPIYPGTVANSGFVWDFENVIFLVVTIFGWGIDPTNIFVHTSAGELAGISSVHHQFGQSEILSNPVKTSIHFVDKPCRSKWHRNHLRSINGLCRLGCSILAAVQDPGFMPTNQVTNLWKTHKWSPCVLTLLTSGFFALFRLDGLWEPQHGAKKLQRETPKEGGNKIGRSPGNIDLNERFLHTQYHLWYMIPSGTHTSYIQLWHIKPSDTTIYHLYECIWAIKLPQHSVNAKYDTPRFIVSESPAQWNRYTLQKINSQPRFPVLAGALGMIWAPLTRWQKTIISPNSTPTPSVATPLSLRSLARSRLRRSWEQPAGYSNPPQLPLQSSCNCDPFSQSSSYNKAL